MTKVPGARFRNVLYHRCGHLWTSGKITDLSRLECHSIVGPSDILFHLSHVPATRICAQN